MSHDKMDTISIEINLADHMCSDGFPRVNFASLIEPPSIPSTPTNSEIPTTSGEAVPDRIAGKKEINFSRQPNLQSGKTYKGIREQDFHEVAEGYDTDDSFVDDSEAYEDFAPSENKLVHGSFYVNKGKVEFTYDPPEGAIIDSPPPQKAKIAKPAKIDTSQDAGSPGEMKRSGSFVGNEGYMITPPKKTNKKRKDSVKFSPKMVLKRSKSFKSQQPESKIATPPLDKLDSSPNDVDVEPMPTENKVAKNLFPTPPKAESEKTQKPVTKAVPQTSTQSVSSKKTEKISPQQVATPNSMININTILLAKLIESNILVQMDLTTDCFTPGFYEKNNIHTFSSQIPDSLANILQLFFNHIQTIMSNPSHLNSQENRFERCLILGKIHAFLKRKQESTLTESIQNFLAPFFLNKSHSLTFILETVLNLIQTAFISPPLHALITQIQPHIDRINENKNVEGPQDDKQTASKKRFKWSFELKKLLGNSVSAQIEIEKNGFGVCPDKLTNEQIILQFLGSYILPCWPKGRMKSSKLYKVTLPYHQHFTQPQLLSDESTPPLTTVITTSSPPTSSNTKLGNWKLHEYMSTGGSTEHLKPSVTPPKKSEKSPEKVIHRPDPVKIISPSNKLTSPKSKVAHTNQLNRELIPVTSLIPLASLSAKKSPLLKKPGEMLKHVEKSPNPPIQLKSELDTKANIQMNKSPIQMNKSPIQMNKSPIQMNKSPIRMNKSPIPYTSEIDVKPILPSSSFNTHAQLTPQQMKLIPANFLSNIRQNMILPPSSALFANSLPQTTNALVNSPFNVLNTANFGQNIAFISAYPETIIHLKPESNENSPKKAKSHSQP